MPLVTVAYGLLLVLLGVGGWILTDRVSATALIPAWFGLPILAAGLLARRERPGRKALAVAAVLALLGLLGSFPGLLALPSALDGTAERPAAVWSQATMLALSAAYLALYVRALLQDRRAPSRPA